MVVSRQGTIDAQAFPQEVCCAGFSRIAVYRSTQFSDSERAALAARLIDSLDSAVDEDAGSAWADEFRLRTVQLDSGEVTPIPWSEAWQVILGWR